MIYIPQFKVVPATKQSFADGLQVITDPEDLEASPIKWNSLTDGRDFTTTSGNNVIAFSGNSLAAETEIGNNFLATYVPRYVFQTGR